MPVICKERVDGRRQVDAKSGLSEDRAYTDRRVPDPTVLSPIRGFEVLGPSSGPSRKFQICLRRLDLCGSMTQRLNDLRPRIGHEYGRKLEQNDGNCSRYVVTSKQSAHVTRISCVET
jgi:hypothetical protein